MSIITEHNKNFFQLKQYAIHTLTALYRCIFYNYFMATFYCLTFMLLIVLVQINFMGSPCGQGFSPCGLPNQILSPCSIPHIYLSHSSQNKHRDLWKQDSNRCDSNKYTGHLQLSNTFGKELTEHLFFLLMELNDGKGLRNKVHSVQKEHNCLTFVQN